MSYFNQLKWFLPIALFCFKVEAKQTITIQHNAGDMTLAVRNAIESVTDKDIKIIFTKGTYTFLPDYAKEKFSFVTNHGNGLKKIIFLLENFNSVEIDGNGSEFIFHGHTAPFQIFNCNSVSIKNLTIDWETKKNFGLK
jgi:hypothetical protein